METVDLTALGVGPGDRVLDVGCGDGRHMHAACLEGLDAVGVDLDRERLTRARDDYETFVAPETNGTAFAVAAGDAVSLPFPDESFDAVVCSEVLEHLPDYEAAIDELVRVLAPRGHLAVSVPRYGPERLCWWLSDEYHRVEGGHVRIFRRDELRSALEARDLRFVRSHFAHGLHAPYWWLKCLWWDREDDDQPLLLSAYERLLEWDILSNPRPRSTRAAEAILDPFVGKSLVLYCVKEP